MAIIVVVIVVVIGALAASGVFTSKSSSSSSSPSVHTENLINTVDTTFGPDFTDADVASFTLPTGTTGAWVNGTFEVTVCTSIGNYCLANADIMTPSAWSNLVGGGSVSVVWCYTVGSSCPSEQNIIIASGDLSAYAGQTLDLCMFSNATTLSQQFTADVNVTWVT